jgi:hypothetical protein
MALVTQAGLAWASLLRPVGAQIGANTPRVQQKIWDMLSRGERVAAQRRRVRGV